MKFGDVEIKWMGNSGFLIKTKNKVIYIDPYQISGGEKADIILLTHPHHDHCSVEDIRKIVKENTIVVMPADCQSKVARLEVEMRIIGAGETLDLGVVKVGAVPAYNLDKNFHSKGEGWIGYILKIGETMVYHAGDTDFIPEMQQLNKYSIKDFIALLPVGGTYTMAAKEAADAAFVIKPKVAIPMHYGSVAGGVHDADNFARLCKTRGINAEILEKE